MEDNPKFRVPEMVDRLYVCTAPEPVALGGQRLDFVPFYVGVAPGRGSGS